MNKRILWYTLLMFLSIGMHAQKIDLTDPQFFTIPGSTPKPKAKATVLIFYSPVCQACLRYTHSIREIQDSFSSKQVNILLIYPGKKLSKGQIKAFQKKYKLLDIPGLLDERLLLTKQFGAKTMPEAFVLDQQGAIVYHGEIASLVEKPNEHFGVYIKDALNALLFGKEVMSVNNTPLGCPINQLK